MIRAHFMRLFVATILAVWGGVAVEVAAQWTEVPGTAPMGGWRVEVEAVSVATDRYTLDRDGVAYRSTVAGSVLVSAGLTPTWDVQFGADLWRKESAKDVSDTTAESGRGDLWLRTKWNLAGDENEGP
ncbi:MAG: hypothetical protein ACO3DQ_02810, partial [Cephaloticoccus sp.]